MLDNNQIINLESKIDFTLLDPRATDADLEKLCDIAYKHSYYSVCVNSGNVGFVKGYIKSNLNDSLKLVSVAGFPLGASSTAAKISEIKDAILNGADEIDVVVNIGKVKQGKFDYVKNELKKIKSLLRKRVLKVIIETCYLNKNEIVKLAKICAQCKIDFVKTSTGFGTGGATEEDIKLINETVKSACGIKASGGIRTREQAINFINLGASRIGTSHIL